VHIIIIVANRLEGQIAATSTTSTVAMPSISPAGGNSEVDPDSHAPTLHLRMRAQFGPKAKVTKEVFVHAAQVPPPHPPQQYRRQNTPGSPKTTSSCSFFFTSCKKRSTSPMLLISSLRRQGRVHARRRYIPMGLIGIRSSLCPSLDLRACGGMRVICRGWGRGRGVGRARSLEALVRHGLWRSLEGGASRVYQGPVVR